MIKKLTSILLVLSMLICATVTYAARADRSGSVIVSSAEPTETAEPTDEPTPEPTETAEPTDEPTPEPTVIPTARPSQPPKPTNTPTPKPTNTPKPSEQPTETPTDAPQTPLTIITESLPKGKMGEKYQARIEANYGDARFSIYNSSSGSNDFGATGLKLSSEGVLSGTPAKAGTFKFTVAVTSDSAGQSVRKEYTLVIENADSTTAPTAVPSYTPPSATYTPAPTDSAIVITAAPTVAPTQPSYIAYTLWEDAAETIQRVRVGEFFDIRLIEGISDHLSFSSFYGNIPSSVQFINDIVATRSCSIRGRFSTENSCEFAVEFTIRGGRKLMLNFRLIAESNSTAPTITFPQGHYLVPFGGTKTAMLPVVVKRREEA